MKHPVQLTILKVVKRKAQVVATMTMRRPVQLITIKQIKKNIGKESTKLIKTLPGDP